MSISSKIVDNDMGAVLKVPLTGVGTIYGITVSVSGTSLPQYDCNIVEMASPNKGVPRFEDFVYDTLPDADSTVKELLIKEFIKFADDRRANIIPGY